MDGNHGNWISFAMANTGGVITPVGSLATTQSKSHWQPTPRLLPYRYASELKKEGSLGCFPATDPAPRRRHAACTYQAPKPG